MKVKDILKNLCFTWQSHQVLVYVKIGSHYADVNVTYNDLYIIQNTNRITGAQIFIKKSTYGEFILYYTQQTACV